MFYFCDIIYLVDGIRFLVDDFSRRFRLSFKVVLVLAEVEIILDDVCFWFFFYCGVRCFYVVYGILLRGYF